MKKSIPGFVGLATVVLTLILGLSSLASAANYDATYDLFCNDCIDWQDIGAFTDEWLSDCNLANNWCGGADFSEDGKVDFVDFGLLGQYWWSDFLDELDNLEWDDVINSENLQNWQQPAKLDDFIGVHPRYLLTAAEVTTLKSKIASAGVHQDIWLNVVKPKADWYLNEDPTEDPYGGTNEDRMRPSGRAIPWLALAYLLADEPNKTTYKNKAISWMLTVCDSNDYPDDESDYPDWKGNNSLGGAAGLVGVSIGYDWLYDVLSTSDRDTIRGRLITQANEMDNGQAQQYDVYLANHCHVEYNGLAAAGFVLYGEAADANEWIREADLVFQEAFMLGSCDGSSTEGHPYWGYSMESILCYTEAARDLMGKDYYDRNWVENATDFIIFCTLPDFNMIPGQPGYANCVMSYGDSYPDYRSHGPTHILCRLASEYNNGYAQWIAGEMIDRGVGVTQEFDYRGWASLLWYDDTVMPFPLSNFPKFKHFDDIGLVVSRSGWDEDAVMVGFKCGPMHGHKVQPYYEKQYYETWDPYHIVNGGHGQPDVGSFQVYAYGKWLATEPGYSKYTYTGNKWTYDHCTILAGGLGQWGEAGTWFDREDVVDANASSSIIKAESCADYDYIIGDAENIYRSGSLSKFLRHFVYIKPNLVLIADELAASPSSNYFEWRLRATYPRSDFPSDVNIVKKNNDYYIIQNNNDSNDIVVMDSHFVHPGLTGFSTSVEELPKNPGKSNAYKNVFLTAEFDSTSGGDLLATVLHPRRDEDPNSTIISSSFADSTLSLSIGIGTDIVDVNLYLATQQVSVDKH